MLIFDFVSKFVNLHPVLLVNCTTQQFGHPTGNIVYIHVFTKILLTYFLFCSLKLTQLHMIFMAMFLIGFRGPLHIVSNPFLMSPLQFTSVYRVVLYCFKVYLILYCTGHNLCP